MSGGIYIEGLEEEIARLEKLGQLDKVRAAIEAAGLYLQGRASIYPESKRLTRASVYGSTFKTKRQRRAFFAKLRKGQIEVPYRRGMSPSSERFKARWTMATENDGLRAVVGNNASYARLLMDAVEQSKYAKAVGWQTTDAVMEAETDRITTDLHDALDEDVANG